MTHLQSLALYGMSLHTPIAGVKPPLPNALTQDRPHSWCTWCVNDCCGYAAAEAVRHRLTCWRPWRSPTPWAPHPSPPSSCRHSSTTRPECRTRPRSPLGPLLSRPASPVKDQVRFWRLPRLHIFYIFFVILISLVLSFCISDI